NNWSHPIDNKNNRDKDKALGLAGFHFALYVNTQAATTCKLLQTEKVQQYPTIKQIHFDGKFPCARLVYDDDNLPVELVLNASSFLIPGDERNSSLPAALFEFEIKNKIDKEIEVAIMMCGRNLISKNSVGRLNVFKKEGKLAVLEFTHVKPLTHDPLAGNMVIAAPLDAGQISYLSGWNMQTRNFYFEPYVGLDAFDQLKQHGRLANTPMKHPVESQSVELGGALAVTFKLHPQQFKKIPFIHAWHFPRHFQGHFYERNFKKSRDVAVYVAKNKSVLQKKTEQVPAVLSGMGLEPWLADALMNNLYTLFSSSWFTRNAEFTMYEAPLICPLMGTLDVYFYASVAIGLLFPALDKKALCLFKKNIRPSGYVPHDIGFERIDLPSNGTTLPLWKDLNSKFILMVYRAYHGTYDVKFLREMYPAVKRALAFTLTLDADGDGLPDTEGFDTTFDTWDFRGANSYVGGLFLVSLLATKSIAELLNDPKTAQKCIQLFMKGKKSFEEKLWNGTYYITAKSRDRNYDSCMVSQLAGQWYAYVLGLGRMLPEENVRSAIKSVFALNDRDSLFGATNSVFANGKRDEESYHSQNIWPGVCYSFAALAIYEGFVKEGLKLTKKVWETLSLKNRNPWNQPDVLISKDGSYGFGDYYMRNSVIWSVLLALGTRDDRVARGLENIKMLAQQVE
ncbi:MAG: GH116 family glycosyl hydrolase, partial [Candidatus Omnitrophica bacterium]|nr:GH116 family glycosyl hydrolase [Candidatus Omnitrophota bacterium]